MTEQEKKLAETFRQLIPKLSETDKAHTLGYLEGLAAMAERQQTTVPNAGTAVPVA